MSAVFPHGHPSRGPIVLLVLVLLVGLWLLSGVYRVQLDEQGVVLRFGRFIDVAQHGLNYHLPFPIETALTPKVTRINRVEIGYRSGAESGRSDVSKDVPEESLMLTGDENIVDVDFAVFWMIRNAPAYLFHVQNPESTVKAVAESVMREIVGRMELQPVLTEARNTIEITAQKMMQQVLDSYGAGIQITQVQLQKVDPPEAVIDAFRDVQAARADMERQRNEAEAYTNDVIPRARGEAARILQEAEGYKQKAVAEAQGDAQRFVKILGEYGKAKDVTRERLYLEMMEDVLASGHKVIVDPNIGQGVVPYLPLPRIGGDASSRPVPPKAEP
jgi:membrane protease subunit HflK